MNNLTSGRGPWLACAGAAAVLCAVLRRWQLSSAFEGTPKLPIPMAPASISLVCVIMIAGALFLLLSVHQPLTRRPWAPGQAHRWDLAFLNANDMVYPILVVAAAFLILASAPLLFSVGLSLWQDYQAMRAAIAQGYSVQPVTNNGMLLMATAVMALPAFFGLLQTGRDGFRPGRRGKGGFSAALPGVTGCVWLMESFRAHAANPVLWDYAPQLLAIMCGMFFYMDYAGMSSSGARPRRLLWLAGMTITLSAVALVSAVADLSVLTIPGEVRARVGDILLLLSQVAAAVAVLWRLPPNLADPPHLEDQPDLIQEETEDIIHE